MLSITTRLETHSPHRVASLSIFGPVATSYAADRLAYSPVGDLDAYDRDHAAARHALALGLLILRAQRRAIAAQCICGGLRHHRATCPASSLCAGCTHAR